MLECRNDFTPGGARYAIACKKRKIEELTQKRIEFMRAKKDSHPAYQKLTDEQFFQRKRDFLHWTRNKQKELEVEIEELERYI